MSLSPFLSCLAAPLARYNGCRPAKVIAEADFAHPAVSTGHGSKDGKPFQYEAIKEKWWSFPQAWLFETFGEEQVEFVDAARPAVDSSFFSWCWTSDVGLDVDLVFLETAVNDEYTEQSLNDAEDLLRSILQLQTEPAVVYVDAFALRTQSGRGGQLNGGDAHAPLSAYYDVPQISLRGPVLPSLLRNKSLAQPYFEGEFRCHFPSTPRADFAVRQAT